MIHTYSGSQITGKANGEAETKWCCTRLGHKMARPVYKEGSRARSCLLAAALQLRVVTCCCPLRTPPALLGRTALWPPALRTSGAHSLSRAQSRKAGDGMISVPASSSPTGTRFTNSKRGSTQPSPSALRPWVRQPGARAQLGHLPSTGLLERVPGLTVLTGRTEVIKVPHA